MHCFFSCEFVGVNGAVFFDANPFLLIFKTYEVCLGCEKLQQMLVWTNMFDEMHLEVFQIFN